MHPKISQVWSVFLQQLPNFSDSFRILPTATELYRQVPMFPDEKRPIFIDIFLRSYLRMDVCCLGTSPSPLTPIPRSRPPTPRFRSPIGPGRGTGVQKFTPFFHFGLPETAKKGIQKIPQTGPTVNRNSTPFAEIGPGRPARLDKIHPSILRKGFLKLP